MSRILLILTSVLAIAGIVLGVGKRNTLIETRERKMANNDSSHEILNDIDVLVDTMEKEIKKIGEAREEREIAQVGADEANRKIGQISSKIAAKTQQIEAKQARIDQVRIALEPFDGVTSENLNDRLVDLEREAAEKEESVAALQQEIEIAKAAADRKLSEMGAYEVGQKDRAAAIALQGREATITAVNPDFGFAIVNAGTNRGVPPDAEIFVKRGAERVGELKIREISSSMLVADIVGAASVQPGDQVIFKTKVN